jgi:hypothetical protein
MSIFPCLMLARRVLLLARSFYDGAGLGVRVTDPGRLNAAILDVLARPAVADPAVHDHALGYAIDAELETSFPMTVAGTALALDRLASMSCPTFRQHRLLERMDVANEAPESQSSLLPGEAARSHGDNLIARS